MAFIFELTNDIRKLAFESQMDLLVALGKPVRLVYSGDEEPCSGCGIDTVSAQNPNVGPPGRYPVANRDCLQCGGTGFRRTEVTETINASINWNPRTFQIMPQNMEIRKAGGICELKTVIGLLPKLMKCEYAIVNVPMENYIQYKFKLDSEILDTSNITPEKICFSICKRV